MIFERNRFYDQLGEKLGFVFSYLIFTAVLYFILALTAKLPETWSILHVAAITFGIVILGLVVQRLLR